MDYNFHSHTFRCNHANGTEREYIERAIEGGVKTFGFSDHAPYAFEDGYESFFRVPMEQAEEYVSTLSALREEYADRIDIRIGFEMEYYPQHFDKMLQTVRSVGAEYLILGQHFIGNEHPGGHPSGSGTDDLAKLEDYVNCVIAGMRSGAFTYVAHPDMFLYTGDAADYEREMRRICVASRETGIPLEINFLGLRDHRSYPNEAFWKIAGEERSPVTFGHDAHRAIDAYDPDSICKAHSLVSKYGLAYIGKPKLRRP